MTLAIATQHLTKQFNEQLAVNEVGLEIETGEIYGLIGPNGAGKTTLIRMLAAVEEPTAGEIFIAGQRWIRGQANPELKRQIGFLPDDFPLYEDLTVRHYLEYFGRLYFLNDPDLSQRLDRVVALVHLDEKKDSLIGTLSRGMKQRLSLARSIIHRPTLLLLDEPVSGLDPIARVQFRDILKNLQAEGMTVLISSHILSDLAEFCSSIGIMELGRMVESAPLQDLYARQGHQLISIDSIEDLTLVQNHLVDYPLVQSSEITNKGKLFVNFSGNEAEAAALLRSLIESGIAITEFTPTHETLENIFFKMGHQKTS